jgi:hypothetical protein
MTAIRPAFAVSWSVAIFARPIVRGDSAATVCSRRIAASVSDLSALPSSPRLAAQRPVLPLATRRPTRIAVGMRQGQQLWPLIVEARADGWVIVRVLTRRPGIGTTPPSMQLLVEARDVLRWTRRVRALTLPPADSADLRRMDDTPILGNGKLRLEAWVRHPNPSPGSVVFSLYPCEGGNESTQPTQAEVASLLALLDSAAVRAGGGEGQPPTLARAYYGSEASCPADLLADNAAPEYPNGITSSRRRPAEVGTGFVVDTTGRIEHGSLTFMPGTDPRFARAARRAMAHWRFQPAEWDGTPMSRRTVSISSCCRAWIGRRRHSWSIAGRTSCAERGDSETGVGRAGLWTEPCEGLSGLASLKWNKVSFRLFAPARDLSHLPVAGRHLDPARPMNGSQHAFRSSRIVLWRPPQLARSRTSWHRHAPAAGHDAGMTTGAEIARSPAFFDDARRLFR